MNKAEQLNRNIFPSGVGGDQSRAKSGVNIGGQKYDTMNDNPVSIGFNLN